MSSSGIINLAVGLILVFGATAALCSAATEGVARYCGLRGAFLLRGLGELLDGRQASIDLGPVKDSYDTGTRFITAQRTAASARTAEDAEADNNQLQHAALAGDATQVKLSQPTDDSLAGTTPPGTAVPSATSALLGSPILRNRGMAAENLTLEKPEPGRLPKLASSKSGLWSQCRSLPPYISAESFAKAVVDLVVPDAKAEISMDIVRRDVDALPDAMTAFKASLQALVKNAGNDIGVFRTSVERWFDNQMDHVSREYKRYVARITLVAGAVLVVLFNINALAIGHYLYSDFAVNTAVSSEALKNVTCQDRSLQACLADLRAEVSTATQAGLPLGWAPVQDCSLPNELFSCNWLDQHGVFSRHGGSSGEAMLFFIGWMLTVVALLPGARFWFGLLSKLRDALGS